MRLEISVDHKYFIENIEKLGWKNITNSYPDLKEHSISPSYIIEEELDKKIKEINKDIFDKLSNNSINKILNEIKRKIQNSTLSEFSDYIKHGITIDNPEDPYTSLNLKLIDYDNISRNSFFYAHELKFRGLDIIEPDFTLFINGIPLALVEIKRKLPDSEYEALNQLSIYEIKAPELAKMVHIGFAIGMKNGYVPIFPNYDNKPREKNLQIWKVDEENNNIKDDIYDLLKPTTLLNFLKYYVFVIKSDNNYYRITARYYQYRAAEKSFNRIKEYLKEYLDQKSDKNRGLIWHWIGSGKTYTMFFIAYKFLLNYSDRNPIIFIVVDRQDLEKQHSDIFSKIHDKLLTDYKNITKINSISELHQLIKQIKESEFSNNGKTAPRGIYIVTIQKFQKGDLENEEREGIINLLCKLKDEYLDYLKTSNPSEYEEIRSRPSELNDKNKIEECFKLGAPKKKEILFLIDEAHRSQYGRLASVRRLAFPNAITIGFTATPILNEDKNTLREFSYPDLNEFYLDAYSINDSIKDGATLPIIYKSIKEGENGIRFQLDENEIKKYIEEYLKNEREGKDISEYFEQNSINISDKQLKNIINEIKTILQNEKRINALAKYITEHILEDTQTIDINDKSKDFNTKISEFRFKAMIVMVNRKACVLMKKSLDKHLIETFGEQAKNWSEIVMTYNYNETDSDIRQYMEELRNKYGIKDFDEINSNIIDNFKNSSDPRILIVTDMLITGFDYPKLRVMYLDKPIYSHKLLQAIGRVNRPFPGKETGLVVDSIGLLPNLKKTLIKYNRLLSQQKDIKNIEKELETTLKDENAEENNFKECFNKVKNDLKSLYVNEEDLSIDLDELKRDIKSAENWIEKYEDKIRKIRFYYYFNNLDSIDDENLSKQISRLKSTIDNLIRVVKFYNSLSSYNASSTKIIYKDDIDTIKILLRLINGQQNKKIKSLNKLLNEILDLIYDKTEIERFKEDESAIINDKVLEKMKEISEKEIKNKTYAYFLVISKKIEEDVDIDPFYKKVAEMLNKLEENWIARKQDTKEILRKLKSIYEQITKYSEDRNKMNDIDKILYSIRLALTEEFGESCKEINFNKLINLLEDIKKEIKNKSFKNAEKIIDSKKSELEEQLKKDILGNCKNIKKGDISRYIESELVEKIKDQIIRWLYENGN